MLLVLSNGVLGTGDWKEVSSSLWICL